MHALHYSLRYIICYIFLISLIHSCLSAVQTCVLLWFSFFPVWVLKMIHCLVFTPLIRIWSSFKADTVLLLTQSLIGSLTLAGTSKTLISMECFIKDDVTQVHPRSYELFSISCNGHVLSFYVPLLYLVPCDLFYALCDSW